jgi:hypothetical protein
MWWLFMALFQLAPLAALSTVQAQTQDAHVHGVSAVLVGVEEAGVIIELKAPGDDIVGFEHEPVDAAQKRRVEAALAVLKTPGDLFRLTAAAACEAGEVTVLGSLLAEKHAGESHGEFHLRYQYRCRRIGELSGLELLLFDRFGRMRTVDVHIVSARGQRSHRLDSGNRRAAF